MSLEKNGKIDVYVVPDESAAKKPENGRGKFWHIDRRMVDFKVHFFLFIGALGTSLPYIAIFAKNRIGITATSLAAILTTQQFLFIFTKPIIGYIADYFNKLKHTIFILAVVQTIFFFLLLTIPKIPKESEDTKLNISSSFATLYEYLNSSDTFIKCEFQQHISVVSENDILKLGDDEEFCPVSVRDLSKVFDDCPCHPSNEDDTTPKRKPSENCIGGWSFVVDEDERFFLPKKCNLCCRTVNECRDIACVPNDDSKKDDSTKKKILSDFETYQFWVFAVLCTIGMMCANGMFTLSDTACCESVEKIGADFGRQRLWGAIGWGMMAPIGGLLNDYTDDYMASWILMSVMSAVALVNICRLNLVKPQFSQNLLKDVGTVLGSKEFLAFKTGVLMNGIGVGVIWFYLIWFLTTIGGSRFLCGMVQFVQCFVGEIPFMFYSGWLIKKIGHFNVLTMSLLCYCIRFYYYSCLYNPWLILPMEALHGFTYGMFYTGVASYAKLSAKPGTEATTQAILFTSHEGIGAGIGCVVAGLGIDTIGCHQTFFYTSIFAGCGMILNMVLHLVVRGQKGSIQVTRT